MGSEEDNIQIGTQLNLEVDTNYKLSSKDSWDFIPVVETGEKLDVYAEVGHSCRLQDYSDLFGKDPASHAYELSLKNPYNNTYYLIPLNLRVTLGYNIPGKSCLRVFPGNYTSSLEKNNHGLNILSSHSFLASWSISLATNYEIFLPWDEAKQATTVIHTMMLNFLAQTVVQN